MIKDYLNTRVQKLGRKHIIRVEHTWPLFIDVHVPISESEYSRTASVTGELQSQVPVT